MYDISQHVKVGQLLHPDQPHNVEEKRSSEVLICHQEGRHSAARMERSTTMTNEKDMHAEIVQVMAKAIMGRHAAADLFRRIATQIEWGGSHYESPHAIAQAVCEALARCEDWHEPASYDPFEDFQESYARVREADVVAQDSRQRAQEARQKYGELAEYYDLEMLCRDHNDSGECRCIRCLEEASAQEQE